ncbi:NHLP family bacteriocin export ABC transporter peptidase/permease/ATPase subunit [Pseudoduganella sp. DS3]|uniref:Cyclolysin secretion/processing ATP-binding protein CyaB n=1 Tax=Pseudoduganella guangdongensis TaxID=2692179 RepID=A0A6N9HLG0_9BURK|nr:NHLP family bacteriocin export ABC transporter peptidase/permease/ATPase subunit [Pseudoduganella guangdongensis]MYN04196.1 NHLP family bacteriocin export ABC transporter peptidase/permease/ATPase subunit [Pseudoduganella guangdongensis]
MKALLATLQRAWRRLASAGKRGVHTPSVLQMEAVECGAASLSMVLSYYKKYIALEQLRIACGVSRDGSKANNILAAARQFGLQAQGFRAEPQGLRAVRLPAIIFWNFNHYVVLDGFDGDQVYINDPGYGRRTVSAAEFDQSFTGVVLTFEPGPQFQPSGQPPSLFDGLRRRLVGARTAVSYLVLVGLALVLPGLVIPAFTSVFIDQVLVGGLDTWALPLIAGMLATAAVLAALTWLQRYYLLKLEMRIGLTTAASFFWHVLRLPLSFYNQRSAGDIGARVGINDEVAKILSADLAGGVLSVLTALFFAAIMLFYDVTMSLLTIAIVIVNMLVLRYVSQRRVELTQKLAIDQGKVSGTSLNGLALIESLKASGAESDFFSRWAGYQARLMNSTQAMFRSSIALDLLPKFLTAVNGALLLGMGGMRVMDGVMTIGTLVAFQALVASFTLPVNNLVALGGKIQSFQGDMGRLDDVMRYPCEDIAAMDRQQQTVASAKLEGCLELRNVTFGYSRLGPPLLKDFNLLVKPGQRVALVGGSGCGKSTIAKLVLGLYELWDGAVLFDGKPRQEWPRWQLLNSMAAVDQDIALFSGTVRDNLTMWDSTVAHAVMVEAAKDACIHDVISARAGGYDGVVGEGGANFSGGQRQRLEIARALTANPRLVILDEATSALDPLTEQLVDANLRRRGCACLIVAHRLSSIRDCDEIIVLERGQVVERGTHDTLLALDRHYARLMANE